MRISHDPKVLTFAPKPKQLVGRIMIRHDESAISPVTPEPVIGPRLARTRWAPTRPTEKALSDQRAFSTRTQTP